MQPVGFNQTIRPYRPAHPVNQKSKVQPVVFSGVTGSETFTITTDFPESLNERFELLQHERGETQAQVIADGLALLEQLAIAKQKDRSSEFLWFKAQPGVLRLYTTIHPWQIYRKTPIDPAEKTLAQSFDFSVEAYVDLKKTASALGRSLEQTIGDAITVLWNIRDFKQQIPDGHLGIMINGELRYFKGDI